MDETGSGPSESIVPGEEQKVVGAMVSISLMKRPRRNRSRPYHGLPFPVNII